MSGPEILDKIDQEQKSSTSTIPDVDINDTSGTTSKSAAPKSEFKTFNDAFAHYRRKLGKNKMFKWRNPKTGIEKEFTTDRADDPHVPKINDSVDVGLSRNINRLKVLAGI